MDDRPTLDALIQANRERIESRLYAQRVRETGEEARRKALADPREIAGVIENVELHADASEDVLKAYCADARRCKFVAVSVNPCQVGYVARALAGSGVRVGGVVSFPFGAATPEIKAAEALDSIRRGAVELDMVMNIGALKSGDDQLVLEDIQGVVAVAMPTGVVVKVILETGYLTDEEKIRACILIEAAGADFVKTSTGFGPGVATVEDVQLMRAVVGDRLGVKAAGGVRSLETALTMLRAGATRLGARVGGDIVAEAQALAG